jgi:protein-tyrosine-phosphatase
MAESLLRKMIDEKRLKDMWHAIPNRNRDIVIMSAGVLAFPGMPPSEDAVAVMAHEGIDISNYRSRLLTDEMIRSANLILVMERLHRIIVLRKVPEAENKVFLLKTFGVDGPGEGDLEVPDPIGKPVDVYHRCVADIKESLTRLVKRIYEDC